MTTPTPLRSGEPPIDARRTPWYRRPISFASAFVLVAAAIGLAFAVNASPRPAADRIPVATPVESHLVSPPAAPEVEPGEEAAAAGPWSPCDYADMDSDDACQDVAVDACDGVYAAQKDGGDELAVLIDNKGLIDGKRLNDCPQFLSIWRKARSGFGEGDMEVGKDIKPGTYETISYLWDGAVSDCYWERVGKNGKTIDNDFVTAAKKIRVTIRKGDEMFTSRDCGDWAPAS